MANAYKRRIIQQLIQEAKKEFMAEEQRRKGREKKYKFRSSINFS